MLLDNKKNGKVGDELRKYLTDGAKLSVISGLFSIYGFESLKKKTAPDCRYTPCPLPGPGQRQRLFGLLVYRR